MAEDIAVTAEYITDQVTTMDEILDLYGETTVDDEPLIAKSGIEDAVLRLRQIRVAISELGNIEKELKDKIAVYMKNKSTLVTVDGELLVTWKYSKPSESFNTKLFRADNKEVYEMYVDIKPGVRKFLIK